MVTSTLANGWTGSPMGKESTCGQMGACTWANGSQEAPWERGGLVGRVVQPMRVNSRVVTWMEKALILGLPGTPIRGLGWWTSSMDRGLRATPMEISMMGSGRRGCRMGKEGTSGRMGTSTLGSGRMGCSVGMGQWCGAMGIGMMGFGRRGCQRVMAHSGGVMGVSMLGFGVKVQRSRVGLIILLLLLIVLWIGILRVCTLRSWMIARFVLVRMWQFTLQRRQWVGVVERRIIGQCLRRELMGVGGQGGVRRMGGLVVTVVMMRMVVVM